MDSHHAPELRARVTRRLHVEPRTAPRFVLDDTPARETVGPLAAFDCYRRAADARRERQRLWTRFETDADMDDAQAAEVLRTIRQLSELELRLSQRGDVLREAARSTVRVQAPQRPQTKRLPNVGRSEQAACRLARPVRTRGREHQSRRTRSTSSTGDPGGGEPPPALLPLTGVSVEASA